MSSEWPSPNPPTSFYGILINWCKHDSTKDNATSLIFFTVWHCFISRCAFLSQPQYIQYTYHRTHGTYLSPSSLVFQFFCWQCKVLIYVCIIMWLPSNAFCLHFCSNWIHCREVFVMLCNECSIVTNEVKWPSHFSVCIWLLECAFIGPADYASIILLASWTKFFHKSLLTNLYRLQQSSIALIGQSGSWLF